MVLVLSWTPKDHARSTQDDAVKWRKYVNNHTYYFCLRIWIARFLYIVADGLYSNQPVHKSICVLWTRNESFFGLGMGGLIRLITLERSEFSQKMDVLAGSTSRHTVCHPHLEKSFFTTFGHSLHQLSSRSSEILVCYILTVVFFETCEQSVKGLPKSCFATCKTCLLSSQLYFCHSVG